MENNVLISNIKLYHLGELSKIALQHGEKDRDIQLIDRVEEVQLEGNLLIVPLEDHLVDFSVSHHGIRVLGRDGLVQSRYALHEMAQIVYYVDSLNRNNIIFKFSRKEDNLFDCQVFQCPDEESAVETCEAFKTLFDALLNTS